MFANRHLGPNEREITHMVKTIGVKDVAQLIEETIPSDIRLNDALALPDGISEYAFQKKIEQLAQKINYLPITLEWDITPPLSQR